MISRPKIQAFLGTYQEGAEKFPVHLQLRPGVDPYWIKRQRKIHGGAMHGNSIR